jgi:hypothetical protein
MQVRTPARRAPAAAAHGPAPHDRAGAPFALHRPQLPLAMMMARGVEDVTLPAGDGNSGGSGSGSGGDANGSGAGAASTGGKRAARQQQPPPRSPAAAPGRGGRRRAAAFGGFFVLWSAALLALSDAYLRAHPEAQCLPRVAALLRRGGGGGGGGGASGSGGSSSGGGASSGTCWLRGTHGFALSVEDYTPNIGLFWYFLTELFDAFRPFFKFVLHSHVLLLAAPLALRFPRRPLFVAWALLLAAAALRPYPSAGDATPWAGLAPLALAPQARELRSGLFLANAALLLAVLGPAMWHQWIVVDAANPNFFYSITLLLGVFHVAALVTAVLLTARLERRAAGKPLEPEGGECSGGGAAGGEPGKLKGE